MPLRVTRSWPSIRRSWAARCEPSFAFALGLRHTSSSDRARSHGNVSHHVQVSLDPAIDHAKFRVYSGFGQQLGPIVFFGAAGVIDGLAAFYPKTVVKLMSLIAARLEGKQAIEAEQLEEVRRLQYVVSRAEEFIVRSGIVGIKEATYRVAGFGTLEGGRLPLKGRLAEGEYDRLHALLLKDIEKVEAELP